MITGVHTLIHSTDPDATRGFLRDVLRLDHVDTGGGWLIFRTGPSELGVHPADGTSHQITFMCDDLESTMAELAGRGARFVRPARDDGWGITTEVEVPGPIR